MRFADYVARETIVADLRATTRDEALREVVRCLHQADPMAMTDPEVLTRSALFREQLGTTAVGGGVAVPDQRLRGFGRTRCAVARSGRGIDWAAPDGRPVQLVFFVVSDAGRVAEHLRAMSFLGRVTGDGRLR